jgi:hypothetical protein
MIGYVCLLCIQIGFNYLQPVTDGAEHQAASTSGKNKLYDKGIIAERKEGKTVRIFSV